MAPALSSPNPQEQEADAPSSKKQDSQRAGRLRRRKKKSLIKEHYRVKTDHDQTILLPGVPVHDKDWARDLHDFFNLIFLVPLVVLNVLNWNWEILFAWESKSKTLSQAWTGEWSDQFFMATVSYFVIDLVWVAVVPKCVKSPSTIVQHHVATLLYLLVPYLSPEFEYLMGACMSVEVNTWFLIARRVFNKQGFPPWVIDLPPFISIRIKLISILFYTTWFSIRCWLYPYLMVCIWNLWLDLAVKTGSRWNIMLCSTLLHPIFCILNFKWTFDLLMSKIRAWKRKEKARPSGGL